MRCARADGALRIRLRDFLGGEAAHLAQRQRDLRVGRQRRVAAGEHEAQAIVLDVLVVAGGRLVGNRLREIVEVLHRVEARAPADSVDRLEAARSTPATRAGSRECRRAATARAPRETRRTAPPRPRRSRRAAAPASRTRGATRPGRSRRLTPAPPIPASSRHCATRCSRGGSERRPDARAFARPVAAGCPASSKMAAFAGATSAQAMRRRLRCAWLSGHRRRPRHPPEANES